MKTRDENKHYDTAVQPIECMQANLSAEAFEGFLRGNIIKYACRLDKKGTALQDAKKVLQYAVWLVESLSGNTIDPRKCSL